MKKTLLLVACFLVATTYAQDIKEIDVKSTIKEVTVFIKGAQISRTKTVDIPKGKSVLKFVNLSPFINAKSVQVKAPGDFNILSINHQKNYVDEVAKSAEIEDLEAQIEVKEEAINLEKTYVTIIREELAFLQENRKLGGKNETLTAENLRQATQFYNQQLTKLKLDEIQHNKNIKKLEDEKRRLNHSLNAMTTKKDFPTGEILVKIESKKVQRVTFNLDYLVDNAGWFPSYDIKSKNVKEPIEVVYKANVSQDTKVDWKNVKLKLSSANPNLSNIAPELKPYFIDYYSKPPSYHKLVNTIYGVVKDDQGALPGVNVVAKGSSVGTQTDFDGRYTLSLPKGTEFLEFSYVGFNNKTIRADKERIDVFMEADAMLLEEVVVTGYGTTNVERGYTPGSLSGSVSGLKTKKSTTGANLKPKTKTLNSKQVAKQTAFEFEISQPYSIKSDNKSYAVSMDSYFLPASYEYHSVPKVDPTAYLMANITDFEKYNFLEGEANVFFEDTFIGKSVLDVRYATDTMQISLGRDKNVVVKREKIKDLTTKKFIGSKKEEIQAWEITVKNNKSEAINLVIFDQVPVPTIDEIKIEIEEKSGAKFDKDFGELKWIFSLDSKENKVLKLIYSAKYSKYQDLQFD